jgi:hypothetical protein
MRGKSNAWCMACGNAKPHFFLLKTNSGIEILQTSITYRAM